MLGKRNCTLLTALLFTFSLLTNAQSFRTLQQFTNLNGDVSNPNSPLVADSQGNLYGTTINGGASKQGIVFELSPPAGGSGPWKETILYTFTGGADGGNPQGAVALDAAGNIYGTTFNGGANSSTDGGVIYQLSYSPRSNSWIETVLFDFSTTTTAVGFNPTGAVVFDSAGNLYGVTQSGGAGMAQFCGDPGCGVAFQLQPATTPGGSWTYNDIHDFLVKSSDGTTPVGVTVGKQGELYGTTLAGGKGDGIVFKLTAPASGSGQWNERLIYSFLPTGGDGGTPNTVTVGKGGALFGTTQRGGSLNHGTVFELTPQASGQWKEAILYNFTGGADGSSPEGGVILDSTGALYGTAAIGGTSPCNNGGTGCGTVFQLSPPARGGNWTETTLYDFTGQGDGFTPTGNLLLYKGSLVGTAFLGGSTTGAGTVFRLAR